MPIVNAQHARANDRACEADSQCRRMLRPGSNIRGGHCNVIARARRGAVRCSAIVAMAGQSIAHPAQSNPNGD